MMPTYTNNDLKKLVSPPITDGCFVFEENTEHYEILDFSENKDLKHVEFKTAQPNLQYLDLGRCSIKELHIPAGCTALQTLYADGNEMEKISFGGELPALQLLDLSRNQLKNIELEGTHTKLQNLLLFQNQLTDVNAFASFFARKDTFFELGENESLASPPYQVVKRSKEDVRAYFAEYLRGQKKEIAPKYLFEAKMVVIGNGGVGKTSLITKLQDPTAELPDDRTRGVEVKHWHFPINDYWKANLPLLTQKNMHIRIWDFGGQEFYQGTHQIFFSSKSYFVLVDDTRHSKTDFVYWFSTIQQIAGKNARVLVIINEHGDQKSKFEKEIYQREFGFVNEVEVINLKGEVTDIKALQGKIQSRLFEIDGMGTGLTASYHNVQSKLAEMAQAGTEMISLDAFRDICDSEKVLDSVRIISQNLHEVGEITHFYHNPILSSRVFLEPGNLLKNVYKILDNERVDKQKGRISRQDIEQMHQDDSLNFSADMLIELMLAFGIVYQAPSAKELYVVPEKLPDGYTEWPHAHKKDLLKVRIDVQEFVPAGLMSRFLVALHNKIVSEHTVWKSAVFLEHRATYAEIRFHKKGYFNITLSGAKKELLFDLIHESFAAVVKKDYDKLKWDYLVQCCCSACAIAEEPYLFRNADIERYEAANKENMHCMQLMDDVPIANLLAQVTNSNSPNNNIPTSNMDDQQKKTIFISYSTKNNNVAELLRRSLEEAGFHVLIDYISFELGERFEKQIEKSIKESDATLLLISEESLSSPWVGMENVLGTVKHALDDRPLWGAYLDEKFLETTIVSSIYDRYIKPELQVLSDESYKLNEDGIGDNHLQTKKNRLLELKNNLPKNIEFFQSRLTHNLMGEGQELQQKINNLTQVIQKHYAL